MLALNLINAFLRQYPALCRELSGYNGIVAGIRAGSLNITGRLDENGLFAPTRRRPDTVLVLHDDVLPKILQGKMPDWNDAAVEGDIAIGMNLLLRTPPKTLPAKPPLSGRHCRGRQRNCAFRLPQAARRRRMPQSSSPNARAALTNCRTNWPTPSAASPLWSAECGKKTAKSGFPTKTAKKTGIPLPVFFYTDTSKN